MKPKKTYITFPEIVRALQVKTEKYSPIVYAVNKMQYDTLILMEGQTFIPEGGGSIGVMENIKDSLKLVRKLKRNYSVIW